MVPEQEIEQQRRRMLTRSAPGDIVGAWQAWLVTAGLQSVVAIVNSIIYWLDPMGVAQYTNATKSMPDAQPEGIELIIRMATLGGLVFALVLCGVFVAIAYQMRAGKSWARFVLLVGTVYVAVQAFMMFFATGDSPQANASLALQFIHGGALFFSATAAVAGLILASTQESLKYFGLIREGNS